MALSRWYGRYRVLVWMCTLIAINQVGFGAIVPVVPLYASSFGVRPSAIGLAIAVYGLARFLINVPTGQLADRYGRRATLAFGGAVTVVGNVLCAVAPSYVPFLAARFVAGAGAALILTAAQIILVDVTAPGERGRVMGIYSGVFAFAVGAGPYPGGLLAEHFGLAAPFVAFAALSSIATAVAWFRVPETRGPLVPRDRAQRAAAPSFAQQLRLLTFSTGFMLVSVVSFSAAFARTGALFNVVPLLARERLSLTPDQIGLGLSLISLGALLLAYPSGALMDRFGRKSVIVPATIVSGLSVVLFATAPAYSWFLVACAVWSAALGISSDAPGAYAADMAPPGMNASVMSTYRMLSDCGYILGPLLLGLISDGFGAPAALGVTGVLLVSVGLLFARCAPETYRPAGQPGHPVVELSAADGETRP